MKGNVLAYKDINVIRAPGFSSPGFRVEGFHPNVNIIYGPNGVGKTTLAKAFAYLIWRDDKDFSERQSNINAQFSLDDSNHLLEIDGESIFYQKDGSKSVAPNFPQAEYKDRYYISLHDLLQENTDDMYLAEMIIRESLGGYRISEAMDLVGFSDKCSGKGKKTANAKSKIKEYDDFINKQRGLTGKEDRLKELHKSLEEIKSAEKELVVVKEVIEYLSIDKEYKDSKYDFQQYPQVLERVKENEEELLDEKKLEIESYARDIEEAKEKRDNANRVLREAKLLDGEIEERFFVEIDIKKEELKSKEVEISQLAKELVQEKTKLREEQRNLIGAGYTQELSVVKDVEYDQLVNFAREAEENNNRLIAMDKLRDLLQLDGQSFYQESTIRSGIDKLEEWLRSSRKGGSSSSKIKKISLFSNSIITLLVVGLGLVVNPLFFTLLILPISTVFYILNQKEDNYDGRKRVEEEFQSLGVVEVIDWKEATVRDNLNKLYEIFSDIKLINEKEQYWRHNSKEYYDLKDKHKEIEEKRQKLVNRFGIAPDTDARKLYYLTNRLSRYQDAFIQVRALEGKLQAVEDAYVELRDSINQSLRVYGYDLGEDSSQIIANISDLKRRNDRYKEGKKDLCQAEKLISECEKKTTKAQEEVVQIYERLDLEFGDKLGLRDLVAKSDKYRSSKERLNNIEYLRDSEKKKLDEHGELVEELLAEDIIELQRRKNELKDIVKNLEEVQQNVSNIRAEITNAKKGQSVERALAEKERSLEQLEEDLLEDYEKLTTKVFGDYIQELSIAENRPQVFAKAEKIFETITRGSYKLEVGDYKDPSFRAIETETGRGRALSELSSGTRIQLLLAVRIAFIDEKEDGIMLPIYFDETLANSDDCRAESIIESIIELGKSGRQIFYFTAQKDEVRKWETMLRRESELGFNVIDLSRDKEDNFTFEEDLEELVVDCDNLDIGKGLSHQEYKEKMGIRGFNPRLEVNSVALWYLVEDVELLNSLSSLGIRKWGQLKVILDSGNEQIIPANKREMIEQLGRCLEEFVDCWRVGRGRLVDRAVLSQTGAVSETFIDGVAELAKEVGGNGESIIERLRERAVARFSTNKIDDLEEYLLNEGYIDSREPMTFEEIRGRVVSVMEGENLQVVSERVDGLFRRLKGSE